MRNLLAALSLAILLGAMSAHAEPQKFYLTVFHFNIQYVAGGLIGFPDGQSDLPQFQLDADAVEDRIIVESFEPLLDMLLDHPDWAFTFEMQGYMVDVIRERHPGVLDKMQQLEAAGQAEWSSFHYSDQLWVAYPRWDMEKSWALNAMAWERAGLTIGAPVFTQEGQFGESMAGFFQEVSGQTIGLLPKNLASYHWGNFETAPYYDMHGTDVVISGRGVRHEDIWSDWAFHGDGETAVTGDLDPYLGTLFAFNQNQYDEFEAQLQAHADDGYRISTIEAYLDAAKTIGIEPEPLPPFIEGTWQPDDSSNMFTWMGGLGELFENPYSDNQILTGNVQARRTVLAVESWLGLADQTVDTDHPLYDAYRHLLFAEVSDSTGWRPWIGEAHYSLDNAAAAIDAAIEAARPEWEQHGEVAEIMLTNPSGAPGDWRYFQFVTDPERNPGMTEVDEFIGLPTSEHANGWGDLVWGESMDAVTDATVEADLRETHQRFANLNAAPMPQGLDPIFQNVSVIEVEIGTPSAPSARSAQISFAIAAPEAIYTPSLSNDDVFDQPINQWQWQTLSLAAANGLIGLGNDQWIVKDTSAVHLSANYVQGESAVAFRDDTLPPDAGDTWRFLYYDGDMESALQLARATNVYPTVTLAVRFEEEEPPPTDDDDVVANDDDDDTVANDDDDGGGDSGCGCTGAPGLDALMLLALLGLPLVHRRRGRM